MRRIVYESKLEPDVAHALLARRDVVGVVDQPPPVDHVGQDGDLRRHIFDVLAPMADGRRLAIAAAKPRGRDGATRLQALLHVKGRQMPHSFAIHVVLLTERSHSREAVRDARLIHADRREPAGAADVAVMATWSAASGRLVAVQAPVGRMRQPCRPVPATATELTGIDDET